MNTRETRVERDRFLELVDRFCKKTGLAVSTPDEHTQRRTITESLCHSLVELSCSGNVLLFQEAETERVLRVVIARRQFQRLLELTSGLFKLAHHEVRLA